MTSVFYDTTRISPKWGVATPFSVSLLIISPNIRTELINLVLLEVINFGHKKCSASL